MKPFLDVMAKTASPHESRNLQAEADEVTSGPHSLREAEVGNQCELPPPRLLYINSYVNDMQ